MGLEQTGMVSAIRVITFKGDYSLWAREYLSAGCIEFAWLRD